MAILSEAMKQLVESTHLGFVATMRPDGSSNLVPEASLAVWDDDTLVFPEFAAPETIRDLLANPAVEVHVVDPQRSTGTRFRGTARLLLSGPTFDGLLAFYRRRGIVQRVRHMVLVRVEESEPLSVRED